MCRYSGRVHTPAVQARPCTHGKEKNTQVPGKSACTGWEAFARECFQEVFIMLVSPSYNKIILPDAEVYYQADQFRGVAGRSFAVGE